MSGSGGGGYSPRESGCANLSFNTVLGSPRLPVLAHLRKGQILQLVLQSGAVKIVAAKTNGGDVAGTITTMTQQLIECMERGHEYEAEVINVSGLQCNVAVRSKA